MKQILITLVAVFLGGAVAATAAPLASEAEAPRLATPSYRSAAGLKADKAKIVLQSYTFDNGGAADPQGWIAVDTSTDHQLFTHVDDHLPPLSGTRSLWCGAVADTDDPATSDWLESGYGNDWDQSWVSRVFTVTSPDSMILSCQIQWEFDNPNDGFDHVDVEYRIDGGSWQTGRIYSFESGTEFMRIARLVPQGSTIEYRFLFNSDANSSNADGGTSSSLGGFLLDDLVVQSGLGNILSAEDFESEPIGATATLSGDWHAESEAGFGLYAGMFPGGQVRQDDPATYNSSHFWAFFEGSPDLYNCSEPWTAVPTGGSTASERLSNEIRSPWIPLDPAAVGGNVRIDYDVYLDSPFPVDASAYHTVKILCRDAGGQFLESMSSGYFYGTQASWIPMRSHFFVPSGTAEIQAIFQVAEVIDSPCHRQAPLIDNVVVSQNNAFSVIASITTLPGSLHWAIEQANANPGPDIIEFDLDAGEMVYLSGDLPPITETVHITGYSSPGSQPNTLTGANDAVIKVMLVGTNSPSAPALDIQADGCVVEGLAFNNFNGGDIRIDGSDNTVRGCWMGPDLDGGYTSTINSPRILLPGAGGASPAHTGNVIGGNVPAHHNVISSTWGSGIKAVDNESLTVRGNLIGLRPDGETASGTKHGIELADCMYATIRSNVISGNARTTFSSGIRILGGGDHIIRANTIGLNGAQIQAVPNAFSGIDYQGDTGRTVIGGSSASSSNVIAGNGGAGITLSNGGTVVVDGNKIGTNAVESSISLGNGGDGILMYYAANLVVEIGSSFEGNVIAHNDGAGIKVGEFMSESFRFERNSIHDNDGLEIDFSLWSGTPVPTPVVTLATQNGFSLQLAATLNGDPNTSYAIEFFANSSCYVTNDPEARKYLETSYITTDGSGYGEVMLYDSERTYPHDTLSAIASRWGDYGSSAIGSCLEFINTPQGTDVVVPLPIENGFGYPVSASFDLVTTPGVTSVIYADECDDAPVGYHVLGYYQLATTAEFSQNVTFCFDYDEAGIPSGSEVGMKVLQGNADIAQPFLDVTASHDPANNTICGVLSSLGSFPDHCLAIVAPLGLSSAPDIPRTFSLLPNVPNPFNPQTTIAFNLPDQSAVRLIVYDVSGRLVNVLLDGDIAARGRNEVVWRGRDMGGRVVSAGVYFYRLESGSFSETKRMVLVK